MTRARVAFIPVALVAMLWLTACDPGGAAVTETSRADWDASAIPASVAPDDFADAFIVDAMSNWIMAGTTVENQNAYLKTGGDSAYVLGLSEQIGDEFADALLVSEWRENPELVNFVDRMKHINAGSLKYWFEVSGGRQSEGAAAWSRTLAIDGDATLSDLDEAGFRVEAIVVEHANATESRVAQMDPASLAIDGDKAAYELLVIDDGNDLRVASATVSHLD